MRSCCNSGPGETKTGWSGRGGHGRWLAVGCSLKVELADFLADLKWECGKGLEVEGDF